MALAINKSAQVVMFVTFVLDLASSTRNMCTVYTDVRI